MTRRHRESTPQARKGQSRSRNQSTSARPSDSSSRQSCSSGRASRTDGHIDALLSAIYAVLVADQATTAAGQAGDSIREVLFDQVCANHRDPTQMYQIIEFSARRIFNFGLAPEEKRLIQPDFYIFHYHEHSMNFGGGNVDFALWAATNHVGSGAHGEQTAVYWNTIREFGIRVFDCDEAKAKISNETVSKLGARSRSSCRRIWWMATMRPAASVRPTTFTGIALQIFLEAKNRRGRLPLLS